MFNNENIVKRPSIEMVDEGLRQYMIKVFNYIGFGLCITALTSYITVNTSLISVFFTIDPATNMASISALGWITAFTPFIMVMIMYSSIYKISSNTLQLLFWGYSALIGLSFAPLMILYTSASITRVFLITAATFGGMSLLGYTTNKDLTKIGAFLYMGVWGIIIASCVNFFMNSSGLYYAISYVSVIVFTGLSATDTQKIKNTYYSSLNNENRNKSIIIGALILYMDFINLFLSLLRVMGDRR